MPEREPRPYRIGATLRTTDAGLLPGFAALHAGWYEPGGRPAALEEFSQFLDRYSDPRLTLENLPAVFRSRPMLGTTAEELTTLAGGKITRFCLDFAHLYCAANYRNIPYPQALKPFQALTIRHIHLSNTTDGSIADRHLPLDHPGGGLPFHDVIQYIRTHPEVPVSLEYRRPAGFYEAQIAVFDAVYKKYS